jgi:hypothetical protein
MARPRHPNRCLGDRVMAAMVERPGHHPPSLNHQAASNCRRTGVRGGAGQEVRLTVRESGQGVEAVYRQGVRGPGGRRIAADYRVTAYQPATLLAFKAIGGRYVPRASSACRRRPAPRL